MPSVFGPSSTEAETESPYLPCQRVSIHDHKVINKPSIRWQTSDTPLSFFDHMDWKKTAAV